jgi:DNA-binding NarL/FixJ family response regulator
MKQDIKVFTVDDHEIFRKGLNMILNQIQGVEVVGEAGNGREFLEKMEKSSLPDLVLTDIRMPIMDGIEATRLVLQRYPELKIIAISMFGEESYLEKMLEAGVKGFLLKNIGKSELARAIQSIYQGQEYYSAELLPYFTRKFVTSNHTSGNQFQFSSRERDVLKLVAKGLTSKEIGEKLFISKRTVEGHKAHMIEKTGSKNIVDLIVYAIKKELVIID